MENEVETKLCRCLRAVDMANVFLEPRSAAGLAHVRIIGGVEVAELLRGLTESVERECQSFDATSSLARILRGATQQIDRERRLTPRWKEDFTNQAITILSRGCGPEAG